MWDKKKKFVDTKSISSIVYDELKTKSYGECRMEERTPCKKLMDDSNRGNKLGRYIKYIEVCLVIMDENKMVR